METNRFHLWLIIWLAMLVASNCAGLGQSIIPKGRVSRQIIQPLQTISPAQLLATPSHFQNIILYPNGIQDQTDISITVGPINPNQIIVGSNAYSFPGGIIPATREGYYYSDNEAASWLGTNSLPGTPTWANDSNRTYPHVAFDRSGLRGGNQYFSYLNMDQRRVYVTQNQRGGLYWGIPFAIPTNNDTLYSDNEFLMIDDNDPRISHGY